MDVTQILGALITRYALIIRYASITELRFVIIEQFLHILDKSTVLQPVPCYIMTTPNIGLLTNINTYNDGGLQIHDHIFWSFSGPVSLGSFNGHVIEIMCT